MKACYLHVPFCDSICSYCDFCRIVPNETTKQKWLEVISQEIKDKNIGELDTLYFGGGTPSSLTCDEFKKLASLFKGAKEWTVECNPESVNEEKIRLFKSLGINRISLGVQTFDERLLKIIHRKHTKKEVFDVISCLKKYGIDNISIDLIYGLPNQTIEDVNQDIEMFLALDLKHLSIYSLQIEEHSLFHKMGIQPCDSELEADMYELICESLEKAGYLHYEISSFCREGYHSRHNLVYWQDEDFMGLGCGASGKQNGIRYDNTRILNEYLKQGASSSFIEETNDERAFNAIMMSLRTTFGLDIEKWNHRYDKNFEKKYASVLDKYSDVLIKEGNLLKPTLQGMEILNTILVDFLMID